MPSNNSKYNMEFRERTCKHILESGKSATSIGEELVTLPPKTLPVSMLANRQIPHLASPVFA
jgi:hypothetical protein